MQSYSLNQEFYDGDADAMQRRLNTAPLGFERPTLH